MKNKKRYLFILVCLLFLLPLDGFTQNEEGMLIFQIDGNRYYRKNYDGNDKLISYQAIEVGSIKASAERVEAKLTVVTYDTNDNMKDASQTVITCDPATSEIIMGIFPFAGGAANTSVEIEPEGNSQIYPEDWREQNTLRDFVFNLDFKGGAAGFFGTSSKVSFTERSVNKSSENTYRVSGNMTLAAYIMGVRVSTIEYRYFEDLDQEAGIVYQKFTEKNGNYFTIRIIR